MYETTRARTTEWILSQILPPERAAAAVGDWMEQASERGSFWFWSCVFRTVIAHIWRSLAESPEAMARLGLIGFGLNVLVPLSFFLILDGPFRHGDIRYMHESLWTKVMIHAPKSPSSPPHWEVRWQILLAMNLIWAFCQFQTGRWIARRAPGKEAAACAAVALLGWVVILARETLPARGAFAPSVLATGIAHDIVLFAGALWIRRQFFRTPAC